MPTTLSLKVVIELNLYQFDTTGHQPPTGSFAETPEKWKRYYQSIFNDPALTDIVEDIPGAPLINIEAISDHLLEILVNQKLEELDLENLENAMAFDGGVLLEVDGTCIAPQCCVAISDYEAWESILEEPSSEWTQVWIGHPWIFAQIIDHKIAFSAYTEENKWAGEATIILDLDLFISAFQLMKKSLHRLTTRIEEILKNHKIENQKEIAAILVHGTV